MDAYTINLAYLIHDQMCDHSALRCARWGSPIVAGECGSPHQQHYLDMAEAIIARLEPEIGHANVYEAVQVVLEEVL